MSIDINNLVDEGFINAVKKDPANFHWTLSFLERVVDASVLWDSEELVLTKTDFLAPKIKNHSTYRTEHVGERIIERIRRARNEYWRDGDEYVTQFYRWALESIKDNYEDGKFLHTDYTLWHCDPRIKSFSNMRIYPEGSYILDLITSDIEVFDGKGRRLTGGGVDSYNPPEVDTSEAEIDTRKPHQRTQTLDELEKQNFTIGLQTPDGEYKGTIDEEALENPNEPIHLFKKEDFDIINLFQDLSLDTVDRINLAYLSEKYLQRTLNMFSTILTASGVPYRKMNEEKLK
ncbi:hypothetical protein KY345_00960 [Candidatus Woesearchaeota archaeon]|nr:hypothetical protein [Candidatus Woesearchaeota archaeon]